MCVSIEAFFVGTGVFGREREKRVQNVIYLRSEVKITLVAGIPSLIDKDGARMYK